MSEAESAVVSIERQLEVRTPFGRPVAWAEIATVSDVGDNHELNDDRCLILTSRDLSPARSGPMSDYLLCLLADGATGSSFSAGVDGADGAPAGWRASQLAQAAFVERFLGSAEVDTLDRLKDGLRAADELLVHSSEGLFSSTLTALFLASDGRACAASIGDSVLLVLPPGRRIAGDRRVKKLGYEQTTAVGSGDTTLSYVDETELIEQWWPNKEGTSRRLDMRVRPGTHFVLMTDGIAENLPIEVVDHLLSRHTLETALVALPRHTRERRAVWQRRVGGSTSELGLDNMSAIGVRYVGERHGRAMRLPPIDDATLLTLHGTHGGPNPAVGGQFALVGLAAGQEHRAEIVPRFLRGVLERDHELPMPERLAHAASETRVYDANARLRFSAVDERGLVHTFAVGWTDPDDLLDVKIVERGVVPARDNLLQRFLHSPRLWASCIAAAAVFLLVSTAFATGTVRPAPPSARSIAVGEPTPTPDTRPQLGIGGLELVAPAPPPTLSPTPTPVLTQPPPEPPATEPRRPPTAPTQAAVQRPPTQRPPAP